MHMLSGHGAVLPVFGALGDILQGLLCGPCLGTEHWALKQHLVLGYLSAVQKPVHGQAYTQVGTEILCRHLETLLSWFQLHLIVGCQRQQLVHHLRGTMKTLLKCMQIPSAKEDINITLALVAGFMTNACTHKARSAA